MMRAGPGMLTTAMAMTAFCMPRPKTLMNMMARRMLGKDYIISMILESMASTQRP